MRSVAFCTQAQVISISLYMIDTCYDVKWINGERVIYCKSSEMWLSDGQEIDHDIGKKHKKSTKRKSGDKKIMSMNKCSGSKLTDGQRVKRDTERNSKEPDALADPKPQEKRNAV